MRVSVESSTQRSRLSSTVGSVKSTISRILRPGLHSHPGNGHSRPSASTNNLTVDHRHGPPRPSQDTRASTASSSSGSEVSSRPLTPMLDPSTHTNPLDPSSHTRENGRGNDDHDHDHGDSAEGARKRKESKDVSKHVFYVVNSQTRLKLTAKNERQMLQWITSLERAARESHYTGKNRFDSFAPIRLNVAAQWLVDGVSASTRLG